MKYPALLISLTLVACGSNDPATGPGLGGNPNTDPSSPFDPNFGDLSGTPVDFCTTELNAETSWGIQFDGIGLEVEDPFLQSMPTDPMADLTPWMHANAALGKIKSQTLASSLDFILCNHSSYALNQCSRVAGSKDTWVKTTLNQLDPSLLDFEVALSTQESGPWTLSRHHQVVPPYWRQGTSRYYDETGTQEGTLVWSQVQGVEQFDYQFGTTRFDFSEQADCSGSLTYQDETRQVTAQFSPIKGASQATVTWDNQTAQITW